MGLARSVGLALTTRQKLGSNLRSATSCGVWNCQPSLNLYFFEDGEGFPFKPHEGQALSSEAVGPTQKMSLNSERRKEATGSTEDL